MKEEFLAEINATVYNDNTDEIEGCFDKSLCIDGGESWILASNAIDELTKKGYMLIKIKLDK